MSFTIYNYDSNGLIYARTESDKPAESPHCFVVEGMETDYNHHIYDKKSDNIIDSQRDIKGNPVYLAGKPIPSAVDIARKVTKYVSPAIPDPDPLNPPQITP